MRIYLAGPMRGIADFNFPAFDKAAANLRKAGHTVFNPADNDREKGYEINDTVDVSQVMRNCIMDDLTYIAREAEAVILLPDWEASKGVAVEVALAKFLQLPVYLLEDVTAEA